MGARDAFAAFVLMADQTRLRAGPDAGARPRAGRAVQARARARAWSATLTARGWVGGPAGGGPAARERERGPPQLALTARASLLLLLLLLAPVMGNAHSAGKESDEGGSSASVSTR